MWQSSTLIAEVSDIHHHAAAELTLIGQRPVLIARLHQSVGRVRHGRGAVREGWVDERRQPDGAAGETLVQLEGRVTSVRQVWRGRIAVESDGRPATLAEGHSGIVDAITAANYLLVADLVSESGPRTNRIQGDLVEGSRSSPTRALPGEFQGSQPPARRRVREGWVEGGHPIESLGPRPLIIEPESER